MTTIAEALGANNWELEVCREAQSDQNHIGEGLFGIREAREDIGKGFCSFAFEIKQLKFLRLKIKLLLQKSHNSWHTESDLYCFKVSIHFKLK